MHAELATIRERVHKLIRVRKIAAFHKLDQIRHFRLFEKLEAGKRDDGFDRKEVIVERQCRTLEHVCSVDVPEHPKIELYFDPWRPPTRQNLLSVCVPR